MYWYSKRTRTRILYITVTKILWTVYITSTLLTLLNNQISIVIGLGIARQFPFIGRHISEKRSTQSKRPSTLRNVITLYGNGHAYVYVTFTKC